MTQKQFTNSIVRAQKQMEAWHFSTRKHLFDYDSVVDKQRQRVYRKRDLMLDSEDNIELQKTFVATALQDLEKNLEIILTNKIVESEHLNQSQADLIMTLVKEFNLQLDDTTVKKLEKCNKDGIVSILMDFVQKTQFSSIKKLSEEKLYLIFKDIFLHYLDKLRIDHIDDMQYLRDKVGFMGYAQQDPLVIYKKESFEKFQSLNYNYKFETTNQLMNIDFEALAEQEVMQNIQIEENNQDQNFISKLKDISSNVSAIANANHTNNEISSEKKVFFQDED